MRPNYCALAAPVFLIVASSAVALAQQPASVRIRGEILQSDGANLMVRTRQGEIVSVRLADNARVSAIVKIPLADIKPGSYVGSAAVPAGDGIWRALEVHLFPEAMRGVGEGHQPFDLQPESTMTNATVADIVTRVDGAVLTLKHKNGEQKIVVGPDTPIVTYIPGDRSELKVGTRIIIFAAQRQVDGSLTTASINFGRDGLTPPM